uniref:Probable carboxypeptidase X1 n=1 Tax=Callorhinchus milii TaxID=7868 RepID=A0A4W3HW87_CALMI
MTVSIFSILYVFNVSLLLDYNFYNLTVGLGGVGGVFAFGLGLGIGMELGWIWCWGWDWVWFGLGLACVLVTDCPPLGLESLRVEDDQLQASSHLRYGLGAHRGRLNIQGGIEEGDGYDGSWCAGRADKNQWLQLDTRRLTKFTGVITQGRSSIWSWDWVTSYQLYFSNDTHAWTPYKNGSEVVMFGANTDMETPVLNSLLVPVVARYLRISPQGWYANGSVCLRAEVLGCTLPDPYNFYYWEPEVKSTDQLDFKHHNYKEMRRMMKMVAARCPNITRLYSIGRSFQGRKLHVMEMSDRPGEHELGEGEVGGGKGLLLQLMQFLCEEYLRGWPQAAKLGSELSGWVTGRWTFEGYDMNHNFADLNSILWEEEERWPDPSRVLNHYIPIPAYYTSPNASVSLSYTHSQYNNNYIPISNYLSIHFTVCSVKRFGTSSRREKRYIKYDDFFRWLALVFASSNLAMVRPRRPCHTEDFSYLGNVINGADWHTVPGSMNDFSYLHTNCFELTLEVSCDKFPHQSELPAEWENNKESLLVFIEQV